ncbi:glucosamine-6-phosphate deaminase [Bacillus xiapuensis]|uniref:glucosamine-6-phosphate deaminase n=1 Tax=Bacillus xiapuensis TaxID=2014075 RepID=UPI000C2416EA|nr:glucosamine-6-phosphate deaminase [Bacillus xiapuensis]
MRVISVKDPQEMSEQAARLIMDRLRQKPKLVLGLATGGTPEGTYQKLIENHRTEGMSYRQVTTFNLDEYVGIPKMHPNNYFYYMKHRLFDHIDLPPEKAYLPNGEAEDLQTECARYEHLLKKAGGIDVQLLGIGVNGHIGFNEPGTSFESLTHVVELDESTRKANARFFSSIEEVPHQAITMGIQTIMCAREIVLLAAGEAKAEAMTRLLSGSVTEQFPASVLNHHPHVTVIADEAALKRTGNR